MTIAVHELYPVPVVSPWYHIGIDLSDHFQCHLKANYNYVLTFSDYFIKPVQASATETKHACGVADALFKVYDY